MPHVNHCLSQCGLSVEGRIEGWCWYPDYPLERATIEIVLDGKTHAAVKAARMREEIRGMGFGDGYCGFSAAMPSLEWKTLELRERRARRVVFRLLGPASAELQDVALRLRELQRKADRFDLNLTSSMGSLLKRVRPLEELGATLSRLAKSEHLTEGCFRTDLGSALQQVARVPQFDLSWNASPTVSIFLVRSNSRLSSYDFAAAIRDTAQTIKGFTAEFLVVDTQRDLQTSLLPSRIKNLCYVASEQCSTMAEFLNRSALTARGRWFSFCHADDIGPADFCETMVSLAENHIYLDVMKAGLATPKNCTASAHGQALIMEGEVFRLLGGFDSGSSYGLWSQMAEKSIAYGSELVLSTSERASVLFDQAHSDAVSRE